MFISGNSAELLKGLNIAKRVLSEMYKIIDLDFQDPSFDIFGTHDEILDPVYGVATRWVPPSWWPVERSALLCHGLGDQTQDNILRALTRYAVLDDFQIDDRKKLPPDKIPDKCFFLIENPDGTFPLDRLYRISEYARGECYFLKGPFIE